MVVEDDISSLLISNTIPIESLGSISMSVAIKVGTLSLSNLSCRLPLINPIQIPNECVYERNPFKNNYAKT